MLNFIFLALVWLLRFWLIISPFIFIWLFFDTKRHDYFRNHYGISFFFVTLGSIFCLGIVLMEGIESLLMFIPIEWGSTDADGEFVTTRRTVSGVIAVFLTFVICAVFENRNRFRNDNRRHLSFMKEKANEIQRELYSLQDQSSSAHEQREIIFLNKLYKELDQHTIDNN